MLRRNTPTRTCIDKFTDYTTYREPLQTDFNKRCGYCDIHDEVLMVPFHIDHFAPVKHFKALKTEYSNLVYSCPSCNLAKRDHWPMKSSSPSHDGRSGFVDPCETEYDDHLKREQDGSIAAETTLGIYIRRRLKLQLRKHRFLWLLDKVMEQCDKVDEFLQSNDEDDPDIQELKKNTTNYLCSIASTTR